MPKRQALTIQNRDLIGSTRLLLNTTEHQIGMHHNSWVNSNMSSAYMPPPQGAIVRTNAGISALNHTPNTGRGGFSAATGYAIGDLGTDLVESGIKHSEAQQALKSMHPVVAALSGFSFVQYFKAQLDKQVVALPWLKVTQQALKFNIKGTEKTLLNHSKQPSILLVGITYLINSNFSQLEANAYVRLVKKAPSAKEPIVLYANNFFVVDRLDNPSEKMAINRARWLKGGFVEQQLKSVASVLVSMISQDMSQPAADPYAGISHQHQFIGHYGFPQKGKIIGQKDGYTLLWAVPRGLAIGGIFAFNSSAFNHL